MDVFKIHSNTQNMAIFDTSHIVYQKQGGNVTWDTLLISNLGDTSISLGQDKFQADIKIINDILFL